jgi:hypothetical protein
MRCVAVFAFCFAAIAHWLVKLVSVAIVDCGWFIMVKPLWRWHKPLWRWLRYFGDITVSRN